MFGLKKFFFLTNLNFGHRSCTKKVVGAIERELRHHDAPVIILTFFCVKRVPGPACE